MQFYFATQVPQREAVFGEDDLRLYFLVTVL